MQHLLFKITGNIIRYTNYTQNKWKFKNILIPFIDYISLYTLAKGEQESDRVKD